MSFLEDLSCVISPKIGHALGVDHIHSDYSGYHYYIRRLKPGWPILVAHYRGPLMLVLPDADYKRLESSEITAEAYVEESHFSYGYFAGGGTLYGAYWRPLETEPGIHDTKRISRYLQIMLCRMNLRSSGYQPSETDCLRCPLCPDVCPLSKLSESIGDWSDELPEPDNRVRLHGAIAKRIMSETGFTVAAMLTHEGGQGRAAVVAAHARRTRDGLRQCRADQ